MIDKKKEHYFYKDQTINQMLQQQIILINVLVSVLQNVVAKCISEKEITKKLILISLRYSKLNLKIMMMLIKTIIILMMKLMIGMMMMVVMMLIKT